MPGLPGSEAGVQHLSQLDLDQEKIDNVATQIMTEVDAAEEAIGSVRAA
jgi:hypothetical protein